MEARIEALKKRIQEFETDKEALQGQPAQTGLIQPICLLVSLKIPIAG